MKRFLLTAVAFAVLVSSVVWAGEARTYGKGVTLSETTPVSAILKKPSDFVGKRVRIEGTVVDVCARRGCWIDVAGDKPFEKIQVKVTDGEIVFPMSARGGRATVEGTVEELRLSREQVLAWKRHHAEEKGEAFDPATVTSGETIYRIRGLGAVIEE